MAYDREREREFTFAKITLDFFFIQHNGTSSDNQIRRSQRRPPKPDHQLMAVILK